MLSLLTPGEKGIWKNIKGTLEVEEADIIVVFDSLEKRLLERGPEYLKTKKVIEFQRENTELIELYGTENWYTNYKEKTVFSYENGYMYPFANMQWIHPNNKFTEGDYSGGIDSHDKTLLTYDKLKDMKYPHKTKEMSQDKGKKETGQKIQLIQRIQ